jgi:hypothetical protein
MDSVAKIAAKNMTKEFSEEAAEGITKINGKNALEESYTIAKAIENSGVPKDLINKVAKSEGKAVQDAIKQGITKI